MIRYPFLFDGAHCFLYDIPLGWQKMFLQMCEDIKTIMDNDDTAQLEFIQVKEKYGELRVYADTNSQQISDIIQKYELMSVYVCEDCGAPVAMQSSGWISQVCNDCWKDKYRHQNNWDWIIPQTTRKIRQFSNGKSKEIVIDFTNEWNRLYNI